MNGAIAAGHPLTAEAGAAVLSRGGNAVDACIAAAFAAAVAEGPLTGPAGGGFLLVHVGGRATFLDCFFVTPAHPLGPMEELVVDFGTTTQTFWVGLGSVAVPGLVEGLWEAHARHGTLPWRTLLEPAIALAREGVVVAADSSQAYLHRILTAILQRDEGGRYAYGDAARVVTDACIPTLERIRDEGPSAVVAILPEFAADLRAYRVVEREPVTATFAGLDVLTAPPPSRGGAVVATALERLDAGADLASALAAGYGTIASATLTGTTHIAVVDAAGDAASLSSTLGSGSGVFRGGTQLNNMLGELDVIGAGEHRPGARLPSMMAPTMLLDGGRPRIVLGSAGSVRLAGAIAQVAALAVRGTPIGEAVARPRIHVEGTTLHLEGGAVADAPHGWDTVRWDATNLYFGGVSAVARRPDGSLEAAGDPRRGGHGIVVA
jgi:gamma-glutamyltranspeptidase/glutathione hydrolase